jgi:hypothetical protein
MIFAGGSAAYPTKSFVDNCFKIVLCLLAELRRVIEQKPSRRAVLVPEK